MDGLGHGPPLARAQGLLCREVPEGLMIYDLDRNEAHSLNQTAALVWRHCDGKMGVTEMSALLKQETDLPAEEAVVWLALDRLQKANLLQERLKLPAETVGISRRSVIRKIGLAGGLVALLPLVESLVAPKAAAADSGDGGACSAADCSVCGTTGNGPKLCCSGPSNSVVCADHGSANCSNCPA